jgi:putative transposase
MELVAQVKLLATQEQGELLKQTLETANVAANYISGLAWGQKVFQQFSLHKISYHATREKFSLTAQIVVRCISKVADAYKVGKDGRRVFQALGAIAYDSRVLSYNLTASTVSIWTLSGRKVIPFVCGERQRELLQSQRGESDLCLVDGKFYLMSVCDIETPETKDVDGFLGVDMGIANIAVDSDGTVHQGKTVKSVRYRHRMLRAKLQKKGTKSSRRRLKKLSGKERKFATWTNHNISKRIVTTAKDTNRGIAIEELGGIRDRVTVRRSQRVTLHSWSFSQLRLFLEYKTRLNGIQIVAVDPRNTSRTCPSCGQIDKANRKTQSVFSCVSCGFSGLADHIAAVNIRGRAVVNRPNVSDAQSIVQRQGQSPRL